MHPPAGLRLGCVSTDRQRLEFGVSASTNTADTGKYLARVNVILKALEIWLYNAHNVAV